MFVLVCRGYVSPTNYPTLAAARTAARYYAQKFSTTVTVKPADKVCA